MRTTGLISIVALVVGAACGDITPKGDGDGGNNDSDGGANTADAALTADAAPGVVNVRVLDRTLDPIVGAKVLFSAPDRSEISVKTTNASGMTSETLPAGAIVTVAYAEDNPGNPPDYVIRQVHDVQPGDTIEIGPRVARPDYASLGSPRVGLATDLPAAMGYRIGSECHADFLAAGTTPLELNYDFRNDDCHGTAARRDLLVYAYADNSEEDLRAWATIDDVNLGATGTTFSGAWSTLFDDVTLTASNVPFAGSGEVELRQYRGGANYSIGDTRDGGAVAVGGSVAVTVKLPRGFADVVQASATLFDTDGPDATVAFIHRNVARSSASHAIDVGGLGYPAFSQTAIDISSGGPEVTWTETGSTPASAEARVVFVSWEEPNNGAEWEFAAILPLGASSPMVSPVFPANFLVHPATGGESWPPIATAVVGTIAVGMAEFGDLENWDEIRQGRGLAIFGDTDDSLPTTAPTGATTILWAGGVFNFN